MSYILSYRQFLDPTYFLLQGIPLIIRTISLIIINYFILRASKNQPEGVKRSEYLKWCAIVNLIFSFVPLILPELVITSLTFSPQDFTLVSLFDISTGLIESVPFLISYGVLIFLFAIHNRDTLGSYLYIAGICFLVGFSLSSLMVGGKLISLFLLLDISSLVWVLPIAILSIIASFITLVGFIFFAIHGVNKRDLNFKWAGIVYFIGIGFSFIFSFLMDFIIIFSYFHP